MREKRLVIFGVLLLVLSLSLVSASSFLDLFKPRASGNVVSASSLVSYYKFDGDISDSSGNNFDGIYGGAGEGASFVSGKLQTALSLTGDNYIDLGSNENLNFANKITLSAWIKMAPTTSEASAQDYHRVILSRGRSCSDWKGYEISVSKNKLRISSEGVFGEDNIVFDMSSTKIVADNQWHLVSFSFDGTTGKLYIDGDLDGSKTGTLNAGGNVKSYIGRRGCADSYFIGNIDEARIYNYALSESEIKALYDLGSKVCTDDCSYLGEKICAGGYAKTCGNYDSDSCLDLTGGLYCDYGCKDGACNQPSQQETDKCSKLSLEVKAKIKELQAAGQIVSLKEGEKGYYGQYLAVDDGNNGKILKVYTLINGTDGYSSDRVVFTDVFSGATYTTVITSEGYGSVTLSGKVFEVAYNFPNSSPSESRYVTLNFPDNLIDTFYCSSTCTDSDGGNNIYVKGNTKGTIWASNPQDRTYSEVEDYCISANDNRWATIPGGVRPDIAEYFCALGPDGDTKSYINVNGYNCPNGCSNGACISGTGTNKLIAYYNLDSDTKDYSGNNIQGMNYGITFVSGKIGNAGSFDGTNSEYVSVPGPIEAFNIRRGITISSWIKMSSLSEASPVIIGKGPTNSQYSFVINGASYSSDIASHLIWRINTGIDNPTSSGQLDVRDVTSTTKLENGKWYFVVGTYDGSTMKLYVNGVREGTRAEAEDIAITNSPLYIGAGEGSLYNIQGISNQFNGLIDEVRIYNYDLSESEIEDLYTQGGGECIPKYACIVEPAICPASGIQVKKCDDVQCGGNGYTEDVTCNPGECSGCELGGKCIPYGFRTKIQEKKVYCEVDGTFANQKIKELDGSWARCQNNYECESNLCSSGECLEINDMIANVKGFKSIGMKIMCRLSSIFGIKEYNQCIVDYLS